MYQLIDPSDYDEVTRLLGDQPEVNAHMVSALKHWGYLNEASRTYIRLMGNAIVGVVVMINQGAIVYERPNADLSDLRDFIHWQKPKSLTGPGGIIQILLKDKPVVKSDFTTVARLDTALYLQQDDRGKLVNRLEKPNLQTYLEPYSMITLKEKISLQNTVFEMDVDLFHEGVYHLHQSGILKGYLVRCHDSVVSVGEWLDQHGVFGLIVGIATHEDHRRNHYARLISIKLCKDIMDAGKIPLLRYSNPAAGALYKSLGFTIVGSLATLYYQ